METVLVETYTTGAASRGVYRIGLDGGSLQNPDCTVELRDPSYLAKSGDILALPENGSLRFADKVEIPSAVALIRE